MKKSLYLFLLFILFTAVSCIKDEQAYTTFTGDMVYSYLQKDSSYSEFVRIIDKAGLKGMLSAYGEYTCLAPTNGAMRKYYAEQGTDFNFDSLRQGQIDTLAKSHITANRYRTYELTNGILPSVNMLYQAIEVMFDAEQGGIRLNGSSRIVLKDKEVYNGVIHGISSVLKFMTTQLPYFMKENRDISIFTEALFLTHLSDSLLPIRDLRIDAPRAIEVQNFNNYTGYVKSPIRKFGYTAFVESNELLRKNGINHLDDLIERAKQMYPCESIYETDYTNRNNSLNKYIAYHLVNKAIYINTFFYTRNAIKGYTPDEFIETMLTYRIIRASNVNSTITLNYGSNNQVQVIEADNQRAINGVYHLIDRMLVYTETVERMLQNTRIRFDVSSLIPELTNNNFRGINDPMDQLSGAQIGFEDGYLSNITASEQTKLVYSSGYSQVISIFPNFQTDILAVFENGDVSIRLLPVPPGTYELRVGLPIAIGSRVVQVYVENLPAGIPLDLGTNLTKIGYQFDEETNDNGVKNDQILHNKGWMKGPNSFKTGEWVIDDGLLVKTARETPYICRKIIGTYSFTDYKPHTIRFKTIVNKRRPILIDYFELVPKSVYNPPGEGLYEARD